MSERLVFLSDELRHLVCLPFSVPNLFAMADHFGVYRGWVDATNRSPHVDIPLYRMADIRPRTIRIWGRTTLAIIKGECTAVEPCPECWDAPFAPDPRTGRTACPACRGMFHASLWPTIDPYAPYEKPLPPRRRKRP